MAAGVARRCPGPAVAGRTRLGTGSRLAALLVVVLLLHVLALQWLARNLEPMSVLRPMPIPMFTRLLQPQAPAAAPSAPQPALRARARRPAITSLPRAKAPAAPKKVPQAAPEPASEPAAAPLPAAETGMAQAPEPAASAAAAAPLAPEHTQVAESTPDNLATAATTAASTTASTTTPTTSTTTATATASSSAASTSTTATTAAPAAAPASAAASPDLDSWPGDTRLNYRLGGYFRGDLHGSARVQWQRQGDRYQTRVEVDLTLLASLVMTSQGEVTPQGLVPRAYEEQRRSGPRVVRMGDDALIVLDNGRSVPRPPGVQDTASQFVELSYRFATGQETLQVGRSVSLWMARPGAVDYWTYDVVALETLQTPELGPVEAFHLKPRPIGNPRGNITAEMWFAPSLRYLPVRIRVNMGESTHIDLMVETIEQR